MSNTAAIFKFFLEHALRYKKYVIGIFIWLPFQLVLNQILPPLIAASVLDQLSSGVFSGSIMEQFGSQLFWYTFLVLFSGTLGWRFVIYLIWRLEIKVMVDIHKRIYDHLIDLDMGFHSNSFGGSLVSRSNKLASSYIRIADTAVFEISTLVIIFIASGIVLWSRAPLFVIALYIMSILYMLIAIRITRPIRTLSSLEAEKQNKITGSLADMVTNVLAVKSFARRDEENARHLKALKSLEKVSTKLMWAQLHRENVFAVSSSLMTAMALILATVSVVRYKADIGTVFLVLSYTGNMTTRLWDFSQRTLKNINKALGDAQEGVEMLNTVPEVRDVKNPAKLPNNKGEIAFEHVSFAHEKELLFDDFNMHIQNGEKIGLVGHSGSGKTTLTKLLLRLKDIQAGSIQINSVDISTVAQDDLRSTISYVPQEPLLFHRSLRENIAYGKPDASEEQIIAASKKAHAHEFIVKLPQGYETLVGERGVKLSGGQKQRIAIARAMLKDAPILVLDEATSALDSESEVLIQDALWKLMEGRTAIVIAHRLSTIQRMDRIIVLNDGNIVESGPHDLLVTRNRGLYARLWKHQSGGFIQE